MGKNNRLVLFNKFFLELHTELKINKNYKQIKDYKQLTQFNDEISMVEDDFISCNYECLDSITLLKNTILPVKDEVKTSKELWDFLHRLYFIVIPKNKNLSEIVDKSKKNIEKLIENTVVSNIGNNLFGETSGGMNGIMETLKNPVFQGLINEIAVDFEKQLDGKDQTKLDPSILLSDLMSSLTTGKAGSSSGINFNDMLNKTKTTLEREINNGNVDTSIFKGKNKKK